MAYPYFCRKYDFTRDNWAILTVFPYFIRSKYYILRIDMPSWLHVVFFIYKTYMGLIVLVLLALWD